MEPGHIGERRGRRGFIHRREMAAALCPDAHVQRLRLVSHRAGHRHSGAAAVSPPVQRGLGPLTKKTARAGLALLRKQRTVRDRQVELTSPPARGEMIPAVDAAAAHLAGEAGRRAGLGFFKQRRVGVGEVFHFHTRDCLADEAFDGEHMRRILGHHDGEGVAAVFGAAGAADAVDVIFGMLRHVVVDDVADVGDVQSARGDVGGDEHLVFAFAETFERLLAFLLRAVGMQHGHRVVVAFEQRGHAISPVLGAAENEDGIVIHALEQLDEQVGFLGIGNGIDDVLDGVGYRAPGTDLNGFRFVHRPLDERFNGGRNGGGEQGGVAKLRAFFHEAADVGQKTHVQHAIGFIENEEFHFVQFDGALFEMVEESSGRGGDDVRAGAEFIILLAVTDAAIDDGHFQIGEARIIANGGFDLRRELARRLQDERTRANGIMFAELGKDRQGERGGFAGAGLRAADDVLAGQNQWYGAELDGGRIDVSHRLHALKNDGRKA